LEIPPIDFWSELWVDPEKIKYAIGRNPKAFNSYPSRWIIAILKSPQN